MIVRNYYISRSESKYLIGSQIHFKNSTMAKTNSTTNQPEAASKPSKQKTFSLRIRKSSKSYGLMNFDSRLNFKLENVTKAKLRRTVKIPTESTVEDKRPPKFGAGSRFVGSNKFVPKKKVINAEAQPYILKTELSDGTTEKYKGRFEGSMVQNSVYYVFSLNKDNELVGCPLDEWYTFRPFQKYDSKHEKVEDQFKKSNHGTAAKRKKLEREKNSDEEAPGDDKDGDVDVSSDDDSDQDGSSGKRSKKKELNCNSDEEAFEEDDDGDKDGRECDYDSGGSDNDIEPSFLGGVNDDKAIKSTEDPDEGGENEFKDFFKWKPNEEKAKPTVKKRKSKQ